MGFSVSRHSYPGFSTRLTTSTSTVDPIVVVISERWYAHGFAVLARVSTNVENSSHPTGILTQALFGKLNHPPSRGLPLPGGCRASTYRRLSAAQPSSNGSECLPRVDEPLNSVTVGSLRLHDLRCTSEIRPTKISFGVAGVCAMHLDAARTAIQNARGIPPLCASTRRLIYIYRAM